MKCGEELRHLLHFEGGLLRCSWRLLGGVGRQGRGLRLGGLCLRRGLGISYGRGRPVSKWVEKRMKKVDEKGIRGRTGYGMDSSVWIV